MTAETAIYLSQVLLVSTVRVEHCLAPRTSEHGCIDENGRWAFEGVMHSLGDQCLEGERFATGHYVPDEASAVVISRLHCDYLDD